MKKKNLILVSLIFIVMLMIQNVSAASYFVKRTSLHRYSLQTSVSKPVYLNLYEAYIDGIAAETYCVDPGKRYGQDGTYRLLREDRKRSCRERV